MSDHDSENSQQEGFVPYQLEVNTNSKPHQEKDKPPPNIYDAHYVLSTVMIRKQPVQCYTHFKDIPAEEPANSKLPVPPVRKQCRGTAYQLYNNTGQYLCVYSRFKESLGNGLRMAFQHEIVLKQSPHRHFQMTRTLRSWNNDYTQKFQQQDLVFDSKFQGGNLLSAYKSLAEPNTYVFFMQNDTNTYGYNQWFYFSVKNFKPGVLYTFRIANFKKRYSFFGRGMRPVMFSLRKARETGCGWSRAGSNISYYPSNFSEDNCMPYYTLEFQIQFQFSQDYVTLSANPPYSYSRLINFLEQSKIIALENGIQFRWESVGSTLGGNHVPYLILSTDQYYNPNKPSIVILGRQHSGQIWSSFLIQQILTFITSYSAQSVKWLLSNYNFHVFPMINVDGVIYGNFRCDLAGYDLNRCWKDPSALIHPQIYKIKEILSDLSAVSSIEYCFDMHTHSKQYGVFGYCCVDNEGCRKVPLLLSKLTTLFKYGSCTFGITREKRSTARAALYEMTKNNNIVTIEMSSFGFFDKIASIGQPFTLLHMEQLSRALLQAVYYHKSGNQQKVAQLMLIHNINEQNQNYQVSGSDSDPEADEIEVQIKIKKVLPKSFLKEYHAPKKKRKISRPYNYKKTTNLKVKYHTEVAQSVTLSKIKPRYNRPSYYKKVELKSEPEEDLLRQREEKYTKKLQNLNRSLQLPSPIPQSTAKTAYFEAKRPEAQKQKEQIPLNMLDFSLKNLPIFGLDSLPHSCYLAGKQNHSLMMTTMALAKNSQQSRCRLEKTISTNSNLMKNKPNHLEFRLVPGKKAQIKDLPYLCIMSQTKKTEHLQRIRDRKQLNKSITTNNHSNINTTNNFSKRFDASRENSIINRLARQTGVLNFENVSRRMIDNFKKNQTWSTKHSKP